MTCFYFRNCNALDSLCCFARGHETPHLLVWSASLRWKNRESRRATYIDKYLCPALTGRCQGMMAGACSVLSSRHTRVLIRAKPGQVRGRMKVLAGRVQEVEVTPPSLLTMTAALSVNLHLIFRKHDSESTAKASQMDDNAPKYTVLCIFSISASNATMLYRTVFAIACVIAHNNDGVCACARGSVHTIHPFKIYTANKMRQ
ncbi:hypothetical protein J6590_006172 [Homalodisca vitripennis]|nr:hypothetical protein J6590_006172 [Homalodisca vitripennis]